jgi:Dockerin type I domain
MKTAMHASRRSIPAALVICTLVGWFADTTRANYLVSLRGPRDDGANRIVLLDNNGNYLQDFVADGVGGLHGPTGMAYGPDGNLYVANASLGANDIVKFDGQTGAPLGTFATGLNGPTGLRYDSIDGNFYATNFGNFAGSTVSKINAAGTVLGNFGTGHALPTSIAIDPTGNIYIGEFGSGAVNKYAANGALLATGSVPATGGISFAPNGKLLAASVVPDLIYSWDGTNANPPAVSQTIDENFVAGLVGASTPTNLYVGGQVYLDATHSVVYSTGLGILLEYTAGNPTPTQFANFFALDPLNGISVGDVIFTSAQGTGPKIVLGDINRDGHLNVADIQAMLSALADLNAYRSANNLSDPQQFNNLADVNHDGSVNNLDLQALLALIADTGSGSIGSPTAVPEPASGSLVLAAMVALAVNWITSLRSFIRWPDGKRFY